MSGNSPRVKKVENWEKPEDEDGDDIMTTPLSPHRIENHSKKGFRVIRPDGSLHRPSAKKLLKMRNMNVKKQAKIVRGERIRSKSKRPKRTVRRYGPNPDYTSPKKKSCCERWFGRDAGKKKCKKKCKTRKKKKSKTRKKKRRHRKKRTKKR